MTKEYLENFLKVKKEYIKANNVYEYLKNSKPTVMSLGKVKGSDKNFPYCERSFTIDGADEREISKYEENINKASIRVKKATKEYNEMKMEIDIFIMQIDNETHREVFKHLYIDNMKKVEVAKIMNYTQPRITQIINEYTSN